MDLSFYELFFERAKQRRKEETFKTTNSAREKIVCSKSDHNMTTKELSGSCFVFWMKVRQHKDSMTDLTTPGASALLSEKLQYFQSPKTTRKSLVCLAEEERHNFPTAAVFHIQENIQPTFKNLWESMLQLQSHQFPVTPSHVDMKSMDDGQ